MTGHPRLPEPPFRRAVPTTPADRAGARVDCFPFMQPSPNGRWSASALSLSRPARASHVLRPAESVSRPRRPLSRGSDPQLSIRARSSASGLSTSIRVRSSLTDDSCRRRALPKTDMSGGPKITTPNSIRGAGACATHQMSHDSPTVLSQVARPRRKTHTSLNTAGRSGRIKSLLSTACRLGYMRDSNTAGRCSRNTKFNPRRLN